MVIVSILLPLSRCIPRHAGQSLGDVCVIRAWELPESISSRGQCGKGGYYTTSYCHAVEQATGATMGEDCEWVMRVCNCLVADVYPVTESDVVKVTRASSGFAMLITE